MISQGPSVCLFNKDDPQEVLASWLFVQFLLSNETQIAYAQTEGYVPVTTKAQNSEVYQDYLNREGEESEDALYYDVKLKATKLLLNNMDNTFVTDVFNGSADLRNAAGELIEETAKAKRRKITVDEKFFETQYETIASRNNLVISAGKDLGPLPTTSVWLIVLVSVAWVGIGTFFVIGKVKEKKEKAHK